ncbi:hypothetical protein GCM10017044_13150 [Kordiimonas sediminis]|uniref:Uncharacterized protein n=1 Tax=Kordiimonas sediminis TaxID=1735581 RepID=A0A919E6T9_9PROT|nr:hypothetical protein GCM10017044_13150 [Kordiimonas sediminis]
MPTPECRDKGRVGMKRGQNIRPRYIVLQADLQTENDRDHHIADKGHDKNAEYIQPQA